jgi:polar amino acid transport system substrate-binding protein
MRRSLTTLALLTLCAVLLAACGSKKKSSSTATKTASAATCTKADLKTHTPGTLTVATDSPAYPPYFEDGKPANGKGFESAVAFAIAKQLGYSPSEVKWVTEHFNASYSPGPKAFDFDVNEISITPDRAKAVDFSAPYFTAPQGIVVPKGSKYAHVTSLGELKKAKFGVQIGTTSLAAVNDVIKPSQSPKVFDNSNDVNTALKEKLVDAVAVDLPTAFYITSAQVEGSTIAGQFKAPGGDRWGALLAKGSPLTNCVSKAVVALTKAGRLADIQTQWMGGATAPELQPAPAGT